MIEPDIIEQSAGDLVDYARVPMSFEVRSILDVQVIDRGLGGFVLSEQQAAIPYVKDYDVFGGAEAPTGWADRWDITNWGILSAFVKGSRVGGCWWPMTRPASTCSRSDETLRRCGTSGCTRTTGRGALGRCCFSTRLRGPEDEAATCLRPRRRTSTFPPAVSTPGRVAPWERSTDTPMSSVPTRWNSYGTWSYKRPLQVTERTGRGTRPGM